MIEILPNTLKSIYSFRRSCRNCQACNAKETAIDEHSRKRYSRCWMSVADQTAQIGSDFSTDNSPPLPPPPAVSVNFNNITLFGCAFVHDDSHDFTTAFNYPGNHTPTGRCPREISILVLSTAWLPEVGGTRNYVTKARLDDNRRYTFRNCTCMRWKYVDRNFI